ncbi:MAG TPA: carboxypeptidase regulatory-like domain-containing protein [Vicinamibacterales bacterium]|nr:carboxypeptidase regulatory-like domain-containing protein [Vicinamibacterales bacterium]
MRRAFAFALLFVVGFASLTSAQAVTTGTGAINGRVTDTSDAVMPGVTVTITSPAQMGVRTEVTDADGTYRFSAVTPGDYAVVFELPGFSTVRNEGIRVSLGFTATVNAQLKVASLQESVTVTGQSPVVDTSATTIGNTFDAKQLSALPTSRDYFSLLAQSPAVQMNRIDVGGSTNGTQQGYTVYGTSGQVRVIFEGINATENTGAFGNYPDVGGMEEVQMNTAAHSAEASTPGVQTQFISKSGGNEFRGTFFGGYSSESWQSFNIDDDQIARGLRGGGGLDPEDVNRLSSYQDVNVGFGGYAIKDRLWWYGSYRHQDIKARFVNFPVMPQTTILNNYSAKVTYNLTTNNKFIGYTQPSQKKQPQRFDSFLLGVDTGLNTLESTWNQNFWAWVHKGEWNGVLSDNSFAELRAGQYGYDWTNGVNGTGLRYEDIGNNQITGRNRNWARERRRDQVLGSFNYFKSGWGGDHNFKIGGEIFHETTTDIYIDGYEEEILHVLNNGRKQEVILFEPGTSIGGLWTYGVFVHDTWRVSNKLTLNLGARFDRYRGFAPEQEHPVSRFNPTALKFDAIDNVIAWNLPAPRFGVTYDVFGDGKTVLKANYGTYWFNPGADFVFNTSPNAPAWWKRYPWTDLNNNNRWEPGEQGAVPTSTRGGAQTESLDPDLQNRYTPEFATFIERELMPNFGVRAGYVWRGVRNDYARINIARPYSAYTVPVSVPDPGPDGRVGTADDGTPIAAFDLAQEFRGRTPINETTNVDNSDSDFHTFEITGTKRMSNRWSLLASYGWTKSYLNDNGFQGHTFRSNGLVVSPNDLIGTEDGRFVYTRSTVKLNSTWNSPWWDISFAPLVRYQQGVPYARTFTSTLSYGNVRFIAEPLGSRRQDAIIITDLRVEKTHRFSGRDISVFFDIYNMFNDNPEQNINSTSGTSFLRPLSIVPPRLFRIGAKLNF